MTRSFKNRFNFRLFALAAAILLLSAWAALAPAARADRLLDPALPQQGSGAGKKNQPPPTPPGSSSSGDDSSSSSSSHPDAAPNPQPVDDESDPKWNPFHAQHDMDVGTFYMHKGDDDAALGRFQDAIKLQPKLAKPRLLIAKIYEKRGDKASAVKYYRQYLQVFPDAPDAKSVRKKIEKLSKG